MADIQAFRGLRYDLGRVGALSDVTAPPYDVIDEELQTQLYERHEHNIVRIILNRGDDLRTSEDIYQRAHRYLKTWTKDGVLKRDSLASVYLYHQTYTYQGVSYCRRGFISRVRIEPFGEGNIYPHEETHSAAREDRIRLTRACNANLSQIFSVYSDPENQVQAVLETAIGDRTPLTVIDDQQVKHELWLVNDPAAISEASRLMGDKALYVADGHHRYETATSIRDEFIKNSSVPDDHPVNYVSMMCVSMDDPGMIVLPTHRLFRGLDPISSSELISRLENCFDCETGPQGPAAANEVWELLELEDSQGTLAFYCQSDATWVYARINVTGHSRLASLQPRQCDEWRDLGVAILHELVMKELFGADSMAPKYVRDTALFVKALETGDDTGRDLTGQAGTGEPFELGCLVMPATLDHIQAVSFYGQRMPAKSTYFYPKLLTGLVINPLD